MINFRLTLTGTTPLLMHNSRLANPLDPIVKAIKKINAKRNNKTDDDHEEVARLEHLGSLYFDPDIGPYIPGENIARCIRAAASLDRKGKNVERGVLISTDTNPISYPGPRDIDGLWKDENFRLIAAVGVGQARIMRCRPRFAAWTVAAEGILDPSVIDFTDFETYVTTAGQMIGLGDWRPRYGRFTATLVKI